ncbi:MAG: PQQ-dependent sugar dehydrogenase, partial [Bacteroidetes bacterium]|nr:PQQ-dependent sugar dehydrogenase [Bacteroidota bacterium]
MKKIVAIYIIILLGGNRILQAQRVYPLVSGISVDSIYKVKSGATKLAMDPVSGRLFYCTSSGDIYEVYNPQPGMATDSLRFTAKNHGITFLQGLCFRDSVMYICGNIWSSTTGIGKIVKGTLQPNGSRTWVDVVKTDPYPTASSGGDHGFAAISIDPSGKYIYVSSGARTHLGEIRTNGGAWPGKREVPITCHIYKFPISSVGLTLPNDSNKIAQSGFVYVSGTRNAYDMAWDGNDTLFAIDNSGERDDPEELNWIRAGKHYGYPWRMGGNDNPLRNSPYNANNDLLVNHLSGGYIAGWFADDPTFPSVPAGITFVDPVRNYGNVADFYRDPITGKVKKASDNGTYITSFTPHRSPL